MSQRSDTDTDLKTPMYPALRLMERTTPPNRYGRPPYWRAPEPKLGDEPFIPSWNWTAIRDFAPGTEIVTLDVNAAYLGAIGCVNIAHSQLEHTGPIPHYPEPRELSPGYYLVTTPYWAFGGTIVSPLGDSARLQTESSVWVMAPTLQLMLELAAEGHIGPFEILDSHTAHVSTSFRSWAQRLASVRTQCMDLVEAAHPEQRPPHKCPCTACKRYIAFKEGYSAALSMMLTGEKCATHRPDWSRSIYATHAANQWRKAWRWTFAGGLLVSMGVTDELTVLRNDMPRVLGLEKPPLRLDSSGRSVGAFKIKSYGTITENLPTSTTTPAQDWDDIV